MVNQTASRAAGNKLATILCILVVPMLLVGTMYVRNAVKDIAFLNREITGFDLARISYDALLKPKDSPSAANLALIRDLEYSLGMTGEETFESHIAEVPDVVTSARKFNEVRHTQANGKFHGHRESDVVASYLQDVAAESGLILDSDETSFHLINALMANLPEVLSTARELHTTVESDRGFMAKSSTYFQGVGKLDEAFKRLKTSLYRASSETGHSKSYVPLKASLTKIDKAVEGLTQSAIVAGAMPVKESIGTLVAKIEQEATVFHTTGFDLLHSVMAARSKSMFWELVLLAGVGLAGAAVALSLAGKMFSSTLRQLDEVQNARDVSDKMREEAQNFSGELANLNGELSKNLKQLNDAQDELVKKGRMEQLGQLTATVAHEIRNPLGSVRTSTFLIRRKVADKNLGIEVQLERIEKGVTRCDDIITQLLDFSRTKSVAGQPTRLDDWLEATVTEEMEQLPASVTLECFLGLGEDEIPFDGPRMRRAIVNLLRNASEAMVGDGKDASKATTQNAKITVTTRKRGNTAEIIVADNGPGMAAEVLEKIREPLFTTKSFGTGLGVPAVEQIVAQHGGTLEITSEVGAGSVFTIALPLQVQAQAAA
jgi:signal transduction histidine kinase